MQSYKRDNSETKTKFAGRVLQKQNRTGLSQGYKNKAGIIQKFELPTGFKIADRDRDTPSGIELSKVSGGEKRHHIIPESAIRLYLDHHSNANQGDLSSMSGWAKNTINLEIKRYNTEKAKLEAIKEIDRTDNQKRLITRHGNEVTKLQALHDKIDQKKKIDNEEADRVVNLLTWTPSNVIIGTGNNRTYEPGENIDFELLDHVKDQTTKDKIILASHLLFEKLELSQNQQTKSLAQKNLNRLLGTNQTTNDPVLVAKRDALKQTHGTSLETLLSDITAGPDSDLRSANLQNTKTPISTEAEWNLLANQKIQSTIP